MEIEGAQQLLARVFRMAEAILRQGQSGRRCRPGVRIADQGKNRVIERGGRNFDRPLLRGLGIGWQNLAQQIPLARNHKLLIFQRIVATLVHQRGNIFIFQKELVKPRNLGHDLQVGEVLRPKVFLRAFGGIAVLAKSLAQLLIPRVAADQVHWVRLEQIPQRELPLLLGQILGWFRRYVKKWILRRPRDIILDLRDQRRHQIEILVNGGKLIQHLHHAVIIFQRMQTHPGQAVLARDQILVKGLVLMPEKNQAEDRHGWKVQSSMADSILRRTEGRRLRRA